MAEGLPPDLLKNLAERIQEFAAARDAQAASRQRFTAATESIRETLDRADKTVGALEAIAVNTPTAHPEVVTKLRMAKRVGPRAAEAAAKPAPFPASPSAPTEQNGVDAECHACVNTSFHHARAAHFLERLWTRIGVSD